MLREIYYVKFQNVPLQIIWNYITEGQPFFSPHPFPMMHITFPWQLHPPHLLNTPLPNKRNITNLLYGDRIHIRSLIWF